MNREHIAIVGDEVVWSSFLAGIVRRMGYTLVVYDSADELLRHLQVEQPDLLLLDDQFEATLTIMSELKLDTRFIVFTPAPSIKGAIHAYRSGALDYAGRVFEEGHVEEIVAAAIEKPPLRAA